MSRAVSRRCVDPVDSELECMPDCRYGLAVVGWSERSGGIAVASDRPAAETDRADLEACNSKPATFHVLQPNVRATIAVSQLLVDPDNNGGVLAPFRRWRLLSCYTDPEVTFDEY